MLTAAFSITRTQFSPRLPFPDAHQLTTIWATSPGDDRMPMSLRDFDAWRPRLPSMAQLAIVGGQLLALALPSQPPRGVVGAQVSGEFFPLLGTRPILGRFLTPGDDRPSAPPAAVLGFALWHRTFGADVDVLGRVVEIDAKTYTVVGVAPEGFAFSYPGNEPVELWVPMAVGNPYYANENARADHEMYVLGRLREGATLQQAAVELQQAVEAGGDAPRDATTGGARMTSLDSEFAGASSQVTLLVLGAVGLMYLAVCANVSGLLLTRAQTRRSEWALCCAVGATPMRLARQSVIETLIIFMAALPGAILGAMGLVWVFNFVVLATPRGVRNFGYELMPWLQLAEAGGIDGWALSFSFALTFAAGTCASLVSVRRTAKQLPGALQESAMRSSPGRAQRQLRSWLVIGQIGMAFALLAGSGMASKGLLELLRTPPGFESRGLLVVRLVGAARHYPPPEQLTELYIRARELIEAQPGVVSTALASVLPFDGYDGGQFLEVDGRAASDPTLPRAIANPVTRDYFATLGIPLLRGRNFSAEEHRAGAMVAIISQDLAARVFPGVDPLGQRIRFRDFPDSMRTIVGVAAAVRGKGLFSAATPEAYLPLSMVYGDFAPLVVRCERPEELQAALPELIRELDAKLGVAPWRMHDGLIASIAFQVLASALVLVLAFAALGVAVLGTYALVAHVTLQRRRELGIRTALGSSPARTVWLVVRGALVWLCLGISFGVAGALAIGEAIVTHIGGTSSFDARVYGAAALVLSAAVLAASLIPAVRAAKVVPQAVLAP